MIEKGLDLTIYGNQWIPLNVECTLFHRLEMSALLDNVDPDGLLEYSVVYTDRSLNHMSQSFQAVMKDISSILKEKTPP